MPSPKRVAHRYLTAAPLRHADWNDEEEDQDDFTEEDPDNIWPEIRDPRGKSPYISLINHAWHGGLDTDEELGFVTLERHPVRNARAWEKFWCAKDIERVITKVEKKTGKIPKYVYQVKRSQLDDNYRGQGLGYQMYASALNALGEANGPVIMIPDECAGGSTSSDARNVWEKLKRGRVSYGDAVSSVRGR